MNSDNRGPDPMDGLLELIIGKALREQQAENLPSPGMIEATLVRHGPSKAELPKEVESYYQDMLEAGCHLDADEVTRGKFNLCIKHGDKRITELRVGVPRGPEISAAYAELLKTEPWLNLKEGDDAGG